MHGIFQTIERYFQAVIAFDLTRPRVLVIRSTKILY